MTKEEFFKVTKHKTGWTYKNYEELTTITFDEIDNEGSLFGNYFMAITRDQINDLLNGKVLFHRDEYGVFIALKEEDEVERTETHNI